MLKFITGNKKKFEEVKKVLYPIEVEQVEIELEELQSLDPHKIIRHKLQQAKMHLLGEVMVEDGSLYLEALNMKLPGPFVKWFNESLSPLWYYNLASAIKKYKASAKTIIGLMTVDGKVEFFEGNINGKIGEAKGNYKFGYDQVFIPDGETRTLSEIKETGNFGFSSRAAAVRKLKEYLQNNK